MWISPGKCSENWTKTGGRQENMNSSKVRAQLSPKWLTHHKPHMWSGQAGVYIGLPELGTVQSYEFCREFRVEEKLAAGSCTAASLGQLKRNKAYIIMPRKSVACGPLWLGEMSSALSQASREECCWEPFSRSSTASENHEQSSLWWRVTCEVGSEVWLLWGRSLN